MTATETGVAGGVSFSLRPEQRELRALAREFAEKEIRPRAAEYDEHSTHPSTGCSSARS
jgi:alkylation response protein AidB-like acyl-CoA dehydrogenase